METIEKVIKSKHVYEKKEFDLMGADQINFHLNFQLIDHLVEAGAITYLQTTDLFGKIEVTAAIIVKVKKPDDE